MDPLTVLIVLALAATVAALGTGIVSMVRGGEFDQKHSTELMFARVGMQGAAVILLLLALFLG